MKQTYRIAEKNIEINSLYAEVHSLCADYLTGAAPDFTVLITQEDIDRERQKYVRETVSAGLPVKRFPDSYLETLAVYRKIADKMPSYNTVLFHGSAIAVDGQAYLFTAKSGTGKSTHTRLWRAVFGNRAVMINDDKPLLRVTEKHVVVCGTPWNGKHRLGANVSVPLKAVCILERGETNAITKLPANAALPFLLQQMYRPADSAALTASLALLETLMKRVGLYKLQCNISREAAEIAYRGMQS